MRVHGEDMIRSFLYFPEYQSVLVNTFFKNGICYTKLWRKKEVSIDQKKIILQLFYSCYVIVFENFLTVSIEKLHDYAKNDLNLT